MKNTVFQIRISEEDKKKLQELAEQSNMSMAEYLIFQIRFNHKNMEEKKMRGTVKTYTSNATVFEHDENGAYVEIDYSRDALSRFSSVDDAMAYIRDDIEGGLKPLENIDDILDTIRIHVEGNM